MGFNFHNPKISLDLDKFDNHMFSKDRFYLNANNRLKVIAETMRDWTSGLEYVAQNLLDCISCDEDDEEGYDWRAVGCKILEQKGLGWMDAMEFVNVVFGYYYDECSSLKKERAIPV